MFSLSHAPATAWTLHLPDTAPLPGFPDVWTAWAFVFTTLGIDLTRESGLPERCRKFIYAAPPKEIERQAQLFAPANEYAHSAPRGQGGDEKESYEH